jgi:PleD family two-component response regulator
VCAYSVLRKAIDEKMTHPAQPKGTVLVVDDDDAVRSGLYWALTSDYQVLQASSTKRAR